MSKGIINYLSYFIFCLLVLSCNSSQSKADKRQSETDSLKSYPDMEKVLELTEVQQAAFDALNTLQVNTDQMNRLYSTFANLDQPCYPADTSFVISQPELLIVMKQFVSKYCQNLSPEVRYELAAASVLAQENYTVLHCNKIPQNPEQEKENSMNGTWVLPNVLGRRDVILMW